MTTTADVKAADEGRVLVPALIFIGLTTAVVGSLGAPLITSVAKAFGVSLAAAQWTVTVLLLVGAIATPVLGRLGAGPYRRKAILFALLSAVAGSLLTVLPLPFAWLMTGRAAQGVALGLTPLMMGVARDHLPAERSGPTIALLSVASMIGVGIGYPLAGYLTDVGGLTASYWLGLLITALALAAAWRWIPNPPSGRASSVDWPGAMLLGAGLLLLLIAIGQARLWIAHPWLAGAFVLVSAILLGIWVLYERRHPTPLIDLGLLRHPAVAGANVVMMLGGIGMYLLMTLVARYVQTPVSTGYGFGLNVFVAGMVLVPFSTLGFVGGKLVAPLRQRMSPAMVLVAGGAAVLLAFVVFALVRSSLWLPFVVMGMLGLGVGLFSAAMPAAILAVTPAAETSSAMSFNQVVRAVGFSVGSALGGLILAAYTPPAATFPANSGYTAAAWMGAAAMSVTILVTLLLDYRANPKQSR